MGISGSPRCKRIECVVDFGTEIWVSSKKTTAAAVTLEVGTLAGLIARPQEQLDFRLVSRVSQSRSSACSWWHVAVTSSCSLSPPRHTALQQPVAPPGCLRML